MTAHTAYDEFSMAVHTETSLFAKEALETGKALIDCGATKSMGSWEALDGLARMNEQRLAQLGFLWTARRKHGTRSQTERDNKVKGRSSSR